MARLKRGSRVLLRDMLERGETADMVQRTPEVVDLLRRRMIREVGCRVEIGELQASVIRTYALTTRGRNAARRLQQNAMDEFCLWLRTGGGRLAGT